ncbi:type II toxin-antitoxin system prevent-host-death family antitoxin [Paracoccus sp. ME4]|uniref:type II toxin-antitoxin system prevent-host-death family antitoxin n=1 Tax=Paracoccus sp. ME4 TaxID=3138066 RepID=UPI00398B1309
MPDITSADFQKHFGHYKRVALDEPVHITIHGRRTLVIISTPEYERLLAAQHKASTSTAPFPEPTHAVAVVPDPDPKISADLSELQRIAEQASDKDRFREDPVE